MKKRNGGKKQDPANNNVFMQTNFSLHRQIEFTESKVRIHFSFFFSLPTFPNSAVLAFPHSPYNLAKKFLRASYLRIKFFMLHYAAMIVLFSVQFYCSFSNFFIEISKQYYDRKMMSSFFFFKIFIENIFFWC